MKKYIVEITETLQKQVEIQASDEKQAIDEISDQYVNNNIELDYTNWIKTEYKIIKKDEQ